MVKLNKKATTALKLIISLALLYFIFTKINFTDVFEVIKTSNSAYLVAALVLFIISKLFAAFRLKAYFKELEIPISHKSNIELYILGMFYNLFLPGGIGGDAYKGYLIKKNFEVATKKVVTTLVIDRLAGLLLLITYACLIGFFLNNSVLQEYKWLFISAILFAFVLAYTVNRKFFRYLLPVFWKSVAYSAIVQIAQLVCVFFIMKAMAIEINVNYYLLVFLISSIVAVVPFTIGGFGSRELTFLYGASIFGLNEDISVAISLTFFMITAIVSLLGVYYHFKQPDLGTTTS